ncbi:Kin of IRRE-like protein 1, partial [Anas platyrhynchos]
RHRRATRSRLTAPRVLSSPCRGPARGHHRRGHHRGQHPRHQLPRGARLLPVPASERE